MIANPSIMNPIYVPHETKMILEACGDGIQRSRSLIGITIGAAKTIATNTIKLLEIDPITTPILSVTTSLRHAAMQCTQNKHDIVLGLSKCNFTVLPRLITPGLNRDAQQRRFAALCSVFIQLN
jgi:hypothetical protein